MFLPGWPTHQTTAQDAEAWDSAGHNIGLRTARYPTVDSDVDDAVFNQRLIAALERTVPRRQIVRRVRSNSSRFAAPFTTTAPLAKVAYTLVDAGGGEKGRIEVLCAGQQFVVAGTHNTGVPLQWTIDGKQRGGVELLVRAANALPEYDAAKVKAAIEQAAASVGWKVGAVDSGRNVDRSQIDQTSLRAPSVESLRECVSCIENDDRFATRDDYMPVIFAIRAAAGLEHYAEGRELAHEWARQHGTYNHGDTDAIYATKDKAFEVGWPYLVDLARAGGYNAAPDEFEVVSDAPATPRVLGESDAPAMSDAWLCDMLAPRLRATLRVSAATGRFYRWESTGSGGRWREQPDPIVLKLVSDEIVALTLVSPDYAKARAKVCSVTTARAVKALLAGDGHLVIDHAMLDANPWLLNTPAGTVDLTTGELSPAKPEDLCSRTTSVAPVAAPCPQWLAFLASSFGADVVPFLQRYLGYTLCGSTREEKFAFLHGDGGNGKGTLTSVLWGLLGQTESGGYATKPAEDVLLESAGSQHTTNLAALAGARAFLVDELKTDGRWNEERLKSLTGGDQITARFMRQDNFTFLPQGKFLISSNSLPLARSTDNAMRRRLLVVKCERQGEADLLLKEKLRNEYPAILAWLIEGCLAWRRQGLCAPQSVLDATEAYFAEQDVVGQWLAARVSFIEGVTPLSDLFADFRSWASTEAGEKWWTLKKFSAALRGRRGFPAKEVRRGNGMAYAGLRLKPDDLSDFGVLPGDMTAIGGVR